MSRNTLQSLLDWMRDPDSQVMRGWDAIAALARDTLDRTLAGDYLARQGGEHQWPAFSGEVPTVDGLFSRVVHRFVLDTPHLSFEQAAVNDQRARFTVPVIDGVQLGLRKQDETWHVIRMDRFDPLQGPRLMLDVHLGPLSCTPGHPASVTLDLQHSDNWQLDFAPTANEQRKGGALFQALFEQLPAQQRQFTQVLIGADDTASLRPQSLRVRAQSNPDNQADGALLVFVSLQGQEEGDNVDASFKYLIPDDEGAGYSATLLLGQHLQMPEFSQPGTLLHACADLIGSADFDCTYDDRGNLRSAVALGGAVHVEPPGGALPVFSFNGQPLTASFEHAALSLPAHGRLPLSVAQADARVQIEWGSEQTVSSTLRLSTARRTDLAPLVVEETYTLHLSASYAPVPGDDQTLTPETWRLDIGRRIRPRPAQAQAGQDMIALELQALRGYIGTRLVSVWQPLIERRIRSSLKQGFKAHVSAVIQAIDSLQFDAGQVLQAQTVASPRDLAVFGRVGPAPGAFTLNPLHPLIQAGASQAFASQPVVNGLVWAVEALQGGDDAGRMEPDGVYLAPTVLAGRFLRARVTALDPATGHKAATQVTVLRETLTLNPLIQTCDRGEQVHIQAGVLGGGQLQWSIRNPVAGESGQLAPQDGPAQGCTYQATGQELVDRTYVLEQIDVRDIDTGASASVTVLVLLVKPGLNIRVVPPAALPAGQLQCQARVGSALPEGVHWYLPLGGPGHIDPVTGVYTLDDTAVQPFVLIMARLEAMGMVFEGHLLLPLPLAEFSEALAAVTLAH